MTKITLNASSRKQTGRKVKALRAKGILPANIYGKKLKSTSIQVDAKEFNTVYDKAGETSIVELLLSSKSRPALIHNVQLDPVTGNFLHVDFYQVNLKEKVQTVVPLEITGESQAVQSGIGTIVQQIQEIEVEALPTDLPDNYKVDVSNLSEVDQAIQVKDLHKDKKVAILSNPEQIIVKVEPIQEEKIEEPAPAAEVETPEGAPAKEGEQPTSEQPASESEEKKSPKQ